MRSKIRLNGIYEANRSTYSSVHYVVVEKCVQCMTKNEAEMGLCNAPKESKLIAPKQMYSHC